MTALIVDDERLARTELKRLLAAAHPDIEIAGEAQNADEAEQQIARLNPDLLFLDVQMPGATGFDLLERLDRLPNVIFTTAYDEYALKAFEVNAIDYLLKPIDPTRLAAALSRIGAKRPAALGPEQRIFVKDGDRCWFVTLREISLLESEGNYTRLYFGSSRPLVLRSLSYLEERLDSSVFFRASRRHIINMNFVDSIEASVAGGLQARMKNGACIEMSRRQSQRFKETMSL